jgi:hypothetical protein
MTQQSSKQIRVATMSNDEIELLKRLEEENRRLEVDLKSPANATSSSIANARSPESNRKNFREDSVSSDLSTLTTDSDGMIIQKSNFFFFFDKIIYLGNLENEWVVWNKIISNWSVYMKRKPQWIRVKIF